MSNILHIVFMSGGVEGDNMEGENAKVGSQVGRCWV